MILFHFFIAFLTSSSFHEKDVSTFLLEDPRSSGTFLFFSWYDLIRIFANFSGAHFNPIVSIIFFLQKELSSRDLFLYILIQIIAAVLGTLFANYIFGLNVIEISSNIRSGANIYISEFFAATGLLLVILLSRADGKNVVSFNVGIYITAALIFTSSTSFANPAVTIARMFTESFTGINPSTVIFFISCQVIGMFAAYILYNQFFKSK